LRCLNFLVGGHRWKLMWVSTRPCFVSFHSLAALSTIACR
jgi:hypothetical protein